MNKEIIKGHLMTLISDCESQENSLRERLDVSWDCFDIGNWASMAESLRLIADELGIIYDSN